MLNYTKLWWNMNLPIVDIRNGSKWVRLRHIERVVKSRWRNDSESYGGSIIECDTVPSSWPIHSKRVVNEGNTAHCTHETSIPCI